MPTLLIADDTMTLTETITSAINSGADCIMLVPTADPGMHAQLKNLPKITQLTFPLDRQQEKTVQLLRLMKIPPHRIGYNQLCLAIPLFAKDTAQSLSKEIYPAVADALGYADWRTVEHSIRYVITSAWKRRDPEIWDKYFPHIRKAPPNKWFISTMAELIK